MSTSIADTIAQDLERAAKTIVFETIDGFQAALPDLHPAIRNWIAPNLERVQKDNPAIDKREGSEVWGSDIIQLCSDFDHARQNDASLSQQQKKDAEEIVGILRTLHREYIGHGSITLPSPIYDMD